MLRGLRKIGTVPGGPRPWLVLMAAGAMVALVAAADARQRLLAQNTAVLVGWVCLLSMLAGMPLAVMLVRTDVPGRKLGLVALTALVLLPLYVQTAAWQAGFGLQGWLNAQFDWPPLFDGMRGAVLVHAAAAVPWTVLIVAYGLLSVERELEELALLDMGPLAVVMRVTLRRALPALGAAALWVAVTIAGDMTVTDIYQVRTYAEEIYTSFRLGDDPLAASLRGLPGVLSTAWLVLAGLATVVLLAPRDRLALVSRPLVFRLGHWRWPAAAGIAGVVGLLAGVPLGNLLFQAGHSIERSGGAWHERWSIAQCLRSIFVDSVDKFSKEIGWSVLIGSLAAASCVVIGGTLAWWARQGKAKAWPAILVTTLALAVPGPLVGLAIVWLMSSWDWPTVAYLYGHSIAAPWLALTIRALPVATLVLWHAWATLPLAWLEVAAVQGMGTWGILWRVALPARRPAVAIAALAALAVALGELSASVLAETPGVTTLAIRIAQLVHYGVDDQLAGLCLLIVVVYVLLAALVGWIVSRGANRPAVRRSQSPQVAL